MTIFGTKLMMGLAAILGTVLLYAVTHPKKKSP